VRGLGDLVWLDRDGDGLQEAGEPPLAGVRVYLIRRLPRPAAEEAAAPDIDPDEVVVAVATTGSDGRFAFEGLAPGEYRLQVGAEGFVAGGPLADLMPSPANMPGPGGDEADSDGDAITLATGPIRVDDCGWDRSWDFGFQPRGTCKYCKGGITRMTLRYIGLTPMARVVASRTAQPQTLFAGPLSPGDTLTLVEANGRAIAGPVRITVNGIERAVIGTDCSKVTGPGKVYGDFLVVEATSAAGLPLCPVR